MPLTPEQQALAMQALTHLRSRFPDAQIETQGIADSAPIFTCTVEGERRWIPFLPDMPICESLLAARRRILTYDVRHPGRLQPGFGPRLRPEDLPSPYGPPARKVFETHELVRLPVAVEARARAMLDHGNRETRLLPQALSEAFGALAGVTRLVLAWETPHDRLKARRGTALAATTRPAEEEQAAVLVVDIIAERANRSTRLYLDPADLFAIGPTFEVAVPARQVAARLVEAYLAQMREGRGSRTWRSMRP